MEPLEEYNMEPLEEYDLEPLEPICLGPRLGEDNICVGESWMAEGFL